MCKLQSLVYAHFCTDLVQLSQAGKVTVGLPTDWRRVTDNSGISTKGPTALEMEMSTSPMLH